MNDILGQAISTYYQHKTRHKLWIHNRYGPKEAMPISTYLRDETDMPDLEWLALEQCRGKILDIGAGAGSHSLLLQTQGKDVTALEISPLLVQVMQSRGVTQIIEADIFNFSGGKFDTLLLLMNGIGLAGNLVGLKHLLLHFKTLLNPGGQLLFDSSDIAYLFEGNLPADGYYGETWYQYEYQGAKTEWFQWLYIDEQTMRQTADETGFDMEFLLEDEFGQYLARLTQKP